MHRNNVKIKVAMLKADMKQWELARLMGIHEGSLSRKMRDELPEEEQEKIVKLIEEAESNGADK